MSTIVVAMSGGVDSSVTAALLVEQGHEVVGVHMKLHDAGPGAQTCCGLDDALDARRVADQLRIPFYVLDLREAFRRAVLDDFADEYLAGRTPNPCVHCNGVLKFRVLLQRALALGASHLATGHYARIVEGDEGPALAMAADPDKDQSYFLFPVTRKALGHTLFPLGGMHKPTVRAHAERLGLRTASKAESMDVCFLPDGGHDRFVADHRPGPALHGTFVDEQGTVLGTHDNYTRFTVGQRRGLGLSAPEPLYVLAVRAHTREVVVGPVHRLRTGGLTMTGCNWYDMPSPDDAVSVRIRHRGPLLAARVGPCEAGTATVRFLQPEHQPAGTAVSPGQAAVVYQGSRVLGGGWIASAVEGA